jgi:alpha-tubulin suppressor-like RCC1 family protein
VGWLTGVAAISAGNWHTAALKTDGTVWTWGENGSGQLGDGTQTDRWTPGVVPGLNGVIAIATGYHYVVALKSDGTVWAWGANGDGQLGDNTYTYRYSPVQVKGPEGVGWLTDVVGIACGGSHTVAVKTDGTVWAWGYNNTGQLGDDTLTKRPAPVQVKGQGAVGSLTDVDAVAAGGNHTAALKTDGTVWAWGSNGAGQLGDGTTTPARTPVQASGLTGAGGLAAGGSHTVAYKTDGTVWAWGLNANGQIGDATITDRSSPVQVSGLIGALAIAGGSAHSVAPKSDGAVWAWGDNSFSAIGDGTSTDRLIPVQSVGITGATAVAAGRYHTLALKSDGTVWAWGVNTYGQLGDGTTSGHTTATQVRGPGGVGWLTGVSAIAAGDYFSVAVVAADGSVWAWGRNNNGQLGDNTTTNSPSPVQVKGAGGTGWLTGMTTVAAGGDHTVARKTDGTVWAWGDNGYGQLGSKGDPFDSLTPVQVLGAGGVGVLSDIVAIAAGSSHTVALVATGGSVWAWGDNGYGQLGDGSTTKSNVPVQVKGAGGVGTLSGISAIGAGNDHTLASDGTVWGWGRNNYGQLGDGTTTNSSTPVQVPSLDGVATVAGGDYHSLACRSDGTARAWGYNNNGQLGDGSTANRSSPVVVSLPLLLW